MRYYTRHTTHAMSAPLTGHTVITTFPTLAMAKAFAARGGDCEVVTSRHKDVRKSNYQKSQSLSWAMGSPYGAFQLK
jgi:hypothetical protein